jgi:uncharacterized membrane protein
MICAILTCLAIYAQPGPSSATTTADPHIAADAALDAIVAKCADCHGPQLRRPKGKFGYITDLARVAANESYIIPGAPDESEFWLTIDTGEMPPDDAKSGPLTAAEKEAIFTWIKLGAATPTKSAPQAAPPAEPAPANSKPAPTQIDSSTPSAPKHKQTILDKAALLLGRLHVLIIHFPIGLLVAAAMLECFWFIRRMPAQLQTTRTLLWLGSAAAILAAGLGWIHALDGYPGPLSNPFTTTGIHRWLGSAAGILAPLIAIIAEVDIQRNRRSTAIRILIILTAALVGAAAHFGGMLTYGEDYFSL